ncbi:DEAD/DEAH box helicase [Herbiconiux sp. SYSU D00978]|uniref:DEAD/DEAH box helicase n=1 Tax=Herbiconiux sp. SYSU D00978 TaxID=2812562 RepID=UPI001A9726AA|nr:DEAD/DEAH box helicase [Herbiconiux sp. SYSU D00978]
MSELLPSELTQRIRESLIDYLTTTFALADQDAQRELERFLERDGEGLFRGPFIRTRLPFRPADRGWDRTLDWMPDSFVPYGHQAASFLRLSSTPSVNSRPMPTLVTTGTGSGKTEAFLIPIIDHVLRAKRENVGGVKALILYPMNALANDQAKRLTELLTKDSRLSAVTAALYTGEQIEKRTRVSVKGLITDRTVIRQSAPDILLTNYKMLDQLLLRHQDAKLWADSATSLQYIVLDEFHTYDGAQGTDVAMLLRRLGATLKSYWTDASPVTDEDRSRPLGMVTPVATSATLGDGGDPTAMVNFARTVFGDAFDADSVVTESRLSLDEWAQESTEAGAAFHPGTLAEMNAKVRELGDSPDGRAIAVAVLSALTAEDVSAATSAELLGRARRHPVVLRFVECTAAAQPLSDLADLVFKDQPAGAAPQEDRVEGVLNLLSMLSHLRAACGREAVSVDVHLWVRELTRIDRAAAATPQFRWSDDGVVLGHEALDASDAGAHESFPAIYCRHCGRSGWGVVLGATGTDLDSDDTDIRRRHLLGDDRFRPLIFAPKEADYLYFDRAGRRIDGLLWLHTRNRQLTANIPRGGDRDFDAGYVLPVLTHVGPDAGEHSKSDLCPSCQKPDGIRFLGSAIATLLSVTLSTLFGDPNLDPQEKKALVFTDSVQDAAHRAGFVQSRSHALTLRAVLRNALGDGAMNLDQLVDSAIRQAGGDSFARYRLVPPDLNANELFREYWSPGSTGSSARRAAAAVRARLLFDTLLEFGLQSRVGRTLELTGSVTAEVDAGSATALGAIGQAVWEAYDQSDVLPGAETSIPDASARIRWVRGVLERMREQGAIQHPWLDSYVKEDGNRYRIWVGRNRAIGVPAFPSGRPAPAFPRVGPKTTGAKSDNLDTVTSSQSWYALWTSKCLPGVTPGEGAKLARMLLAELERRDVIGSVKTTSSADVYFLRSDQIVIDAVSENDLDGERVLLRCNVCEALVPGSATVIDQLAEGPCTVQRCPGQLVRRRGEENFYRSLYSSTDMRRVVAREHTSLLESKTRLEYETAFKQSADNPDAPNVLVATPTLEMGIDIGDLSAVFLASLPKTVASYVQRIGRAGRLTGNSLSITYVTGRGEQLPRIGDPLSVINGSVRPPATYLSAEEILRRQFVAFVADDIGRDAAFDHPTTAQAALGSTSPGSYLGEIAARATEEMLNRFLATFDAVAPDVDRRLREWISRNGDATQLERFLAEAAGRWRATIDELSFRKAALLQTIPTLEAKAQSPAATDEDKRAERVARATLKMTDGQLGRLKGEYWISVLEEYGIFPNYTLLDDSVTLDVALSWFDPDTQSWESDSMSYQRGSASALTEFAPGATFYSRGFVVNIDAIDLGQDSTVPTPWSYCPACGYARAELPGQPALSECPRCKAKAIGDVKQRIDTVQMTSVSAQVRRDDALISDSRDERERTRYTVLTAADIDPHKVKSQWFIEGYDFGMRHLPDVDLRWVNLGPASKQATSRPLAGRDLMAPLFRVCDTCGKLDDSSRSNSREEHRPWCPRRSSHEEHTRTVALMRQLHTQGVLVRLPSTLKYDKFAVPSLSAALLLGLRELMGGAPDHIEIARITEPVGDDGEVADALLLHDVVPGGTGYLADLADPARVWSLLHAAWRTVRDCACADEERLACHRCLLPFAPPWDTGTVARETAEVHLRRILAAGEDDVPDVAQGEHGWILAEVPTVPDTSEPAIEARFRAQFAKRLKAIGATVKEKPTPHGNMLTITLPGDARVWSLEPQVHLGATVPDFVLRSTDTTIPRIAIYTDGLAYHASLTHNRIADDAQKRAILRSQGYGVIAVTWKDLDDESGQPGTPWWYSQAAVQNALSLNTSLAPGVIDAARGGPMTMLLRWLQQPDVDAWRKFGDSLPLICAGSAPAALPAGVSAATIAVAQLTSAAVQAGAAHGVSSSVGDRLRFLALLTAPNGVLSTDAALVLDDRSEALLGDGFANDWRRWLTLSNLMFLRQAPLVVGALTHSQAGVDSLSETAPVVSSDWDALIKMAVGDLERELLSELAALNVPHLPELGEEIGDGIPLAIAWPERQLAVELRLDPFEVEQLRIAGWTVVPAHAKHILAALGLVEGAR